jgi:Na+/melibiose symporter-like transporter
MSSSSSAAPPFTAIFIGSLVVTVIATLRSSDVIQQRFCSSKNKDHHALTANDESSSLHHSHWTLLLRKYLLVYLLATASDWLQGPYVYALYSDYGFVQHEIAVLFVAGFGSSMIFGSFIGGMADWGGRKRFVLLFCAIYAASCATKRE